MRHQGTLGLLRMLGYSPGTPPAEILPSELVLLGVLSVREAQLSNLQDLSMETLLRTVENEQYILDLEESNNVRMTLFEEERARRELAEQQLADLRIRIQGLSEGAQALADEADDALDNDESNR